MNVDKSETMSFKDFLKSKYHYAYIILDTDPILCYHEIDYTKMKWLDWIDNEIKMTRSNINGYSN